MGVGYNPRIVTDGLVMALDAKNPKSYSPNVHPYATDLYSWITTGNACTLSRDTISSPVGSTPLKMVQTGNDPYTYSYNSAAYNLAPAVAGQTWTVSVWVKASASTQIEGAWITEHNSSGGYLAGGGSPFPTIGTDWVRISGTYTLVNASTAYIGVRLDGTQTGGSGITVWWDGLQIEPASSPTTFNPTRNYNGINWTNLTGTGTNLTGGAVYMSPAGLRNGGAWSTATTSLLNNDQHSIFFMLKLASSATYANGYSGSWDKIFSFNAGGSDRSPSIWRWPSNRVLHWRYDPGNLGANIYANGVESGSEFNIDTWYYIGGTKSGSVFTSYVNGVPVGTSTVPATKTAGNASIILFEGYTSTAAASLNCVKVYNSVLTPLQVKQNFNALRGRFGI